MNDHEPLEESNNGTDNFGRVRQQAKAVLLDLCAAAQVKSTSRFGDDGNNTTRDVKLVVEVTAEYAA